MRMTQIMRINTEHEDRVFSPWCNHLKGRTKVGMKINFLSLFRWRGAMPYLQRKWAGLVRAVLTNGGIGGKLV